MQYAGYLTFKVKAQFAPTSTADFSVSKQVRKNGTTVWGENAKVNPGDLVDYMISYKNTGTVVQNNVAVYDTLPQGVTYVAGTTYLANGSNPSGVKIGDGITGSGINIGNYATGATAYVKFTANVGANDQLPACGINTLDNIAKIITDYGTKTDTATVTVGKACQTHPGVTITKKVNNAKTAVVKAGVPFEYEITVTNTGDVALVNAKVSDAAPAGITFLSADKGTIANNVWNATEMCIRDRRNL